MAVQFNPGGEQQGEGPRLMSSGGNIYTLAAEPVKRGTKTTGRGFWAGVKHDDPDNPDVDDPKPTGATMLIPFSSEQEEELSDDTPPEQALLTFGNGKNLVRHELKTARMMVEAAAGAPMLIGKSVLTLGSVKVDILLHNPEELSEEELVSSASRLKFMIDSATSQHEKLLLSGHAGRIAKALRSTIEAREQVAKAIFTKPSEEKEKKPEKVKHRKAQEKKVNKKGKVAYKYPKKGDGKGPNSDRGTGAKASPGAGQQAPQEQEPQDTQAAPPVTPAQPVDPTPFATAIGVDVNQLSRFAAKKDRRDFVRFFMKQDTVMQQNNVTPAYLGRLYDALTTPAQPQQPQSPGLMKPPTPVPMPGPNAAMPGSKPQGTGRHAATPLTAKSVVVFMGATLNRTTLAMIDLLKSHKAETIDDIRGVLQAHYACSIEDSVRHTAHLLNSLERKGLVAIYPAQEKKTARV